MFIESHGRRACTSIPPDILLNLLEGLPKTSANLGDMSGNMIEMVLEELQRCTKSLETIHISPFLYIGSSSSDCEGYTYLIPEDPLPDVYIGVSRRLTYNRRGGIRVTRNCSVRMSLCGYTARDNRLKIFSGTQAQLRFLQSTIYPKQKLLC